MNKNILDVCCGTKAFYFDKNDERVLFCDKRKESFQLYKTSPCELEVSPDIIADFRRPPFSDNSFSSVIFDPPHLIRAGEKSYMKAKYGLLEDTWKNDIKQGFSECFRVLKNGGILIFKWNETQIPIKEILSLTDQKPVLGHKSGKRSLTHWILFMKEAQDGE